MRPDAVKTCPDCGALITPQLVKCRQCGRYLHGTKLEGMIFEHLLPPSLRASPGTGMIMLMSVLYYVMMVMLAGIQNAFAFSSYTTEALGSTAAWQIWQGQYWRFVTSMFGHHDIVHIAFNLYMLASIGRLVEEIFDKKKMMIMYLVSGAGSMVVSYLWHVEVRGGLSSSIGASGAVCGMLGAALAGTHRMGPMASEVKRALIRWGVYLVIWGLVVRGIDNAAHLGGFLVGGALAYAFPLGIVQNVGTNRALSVLLLGMLAGVLFCIAQTLMYAKGFPASLEDDAEPRSALFFTIHEGAPFEYSAQNMLYQDCVELFKKDPATDETARKCELARRANSHRYQLYLISAAIADARGDQERAQKMQMVAERLRGPLLPGVDT